MPKYLIVKNCLDARTKREKRKCPYYYERDPNTNYEHGINENPWHDIHWCNFDEGVDHGIENPNAIPKWCPLFSFKQILDEIVKGAIKEELKG
jgi:hypothetical protein